MPIAPCTPLAYTAYMLFPGLGTLRTRDVGTFSYLVHDLLSWIGGDLFEPLDLDKAIHTGSSLGVLRFDGGGVATTYAAAPQPVRPAGN